MRIQPSRAEPSKVFHKFFGVRVYNVSECVLCALKTYFLVVLFWIGFVFHAFSSLLALVTGAGSVCLPFNPCSILLIFSSLPFFFSVFLLSLYSFNRESARGREVIWWYFLLSFYFFIFYIILLLLVLFALFSPFDIPSLYTCMCKCV